MFGFSTELRSCLGAFRRCDGGEVAGGQNHHEAAQHTQSVSASPLNPASIHCVFTEGTFLLSLPKAQGDGPILGLAGHCLILSDTGKVAIALLEWCSNDGFDARQF